jgi:malonyl-CoA/methylmalonyl-CoA synthetase
MSKHNANLFLLFNQHFIAQGSAALLHDENGKTVSYGEMEQQSGQLANALLSLGLQKGDRVSVQVDKSVTALALYLACLRSGLVFHPLNTAYQAKELDYFLGNAEPGLFVCDPGKESELTAVANKAGTQHVYTLDASGKGSLTDLAQTFGHNHECVHCNENDLAALLYSSGTTGVPKGIMLSHGNLRSNAETLIKAWQFSSKDVLLHSLPIFHVHGLFVAVNCVLGSGASMQWLPGFKAQQVKERLSKSTVMMGVPTYYTRLLALDEFGRKDCINMRLFISGSAPLLTETFEAFEQRTGQRILERYGMTETGMNSSNPLEGDRIAGTVGPALPGVSIRICDDNNQILPTNEPGNVQVKGANVFQGYWKMPEKTAEDFTDDGFFNTGDVGVLDEKNYLSIVGRAKDMIISGGLNIYPKEIETELNDIDGILESAVIGVPHPDFGEAVAAVIVSDNSTDIDETMIVE